MRQNPTSGSATRRFTREFSTARSEPENGHPNRTKRSAVGLKELLCEFPDLLTGRAFVEAAFHRLETAIQFGVLLIRIDRFTEQEKVLGREDVTRLLLDTARAVDRICGPEAGFWGLIEIGRAHV